MDEYCYIIKKQSFDILLYPRQAWGNTVSAWTPEQIRLGGSIVVSGLTDTEIGTLNLTTIESASAAAQTNYFKGAQVNP